MIPDATIYGEKKRLAAGGGAPATKIAQASHFAGLDRPGVGTSTVVVSGGRELGVDGLEARECRAAV